MRVLLVEDNTELVSLLKKGLSRGGIDADSVGTAGDASHAIAAMRYAAVVLDLGLPDEDGIGLLRDLRRRGDATPVLVLTARDGVSDRVTGLRAGADDYLAKPFEPRELQARIKALLRRLEPKLDGDEVLRFGRLEIDLAARVARLDGKICDLTSHQFDLLVVLAQSPGRVLSRDQIMDTLKGHPLEAFDRSIDVHISRIRAVIEDDPKVPKRVLTVRGSGYVFARKQDTED